MQTKCPSQVLVEGCLAEPPCTQPTCLQPTRLLPLQLPDASRQFLVHPPDYLIKLFLIHLRKLHYVVLILINLVTLVLGNFLKDLPLHVLLLQRLLLHSSLLQDLKGGRLPPCGLLESLLQLCEFVQSLIKL
jgi:hypothetical protein